MCTGSSLEACCYLHTVIASASTKSDITLSDIVNVTETQTLFSSPSCTVGRVVCRCRGPLGGIRRLSWTVKHYFALFCSLSLLKCQPSFSLFIWCCLSTFHPLSLSFYLCFIGETVIKNSPVKAGCKS